MKNIGFKIIYILTTIVVIVELCCAINGSLFSDISKLPKGDQINSTVSPSGEKTLNIYVVKNNLGSAVRGEIVTEDSCYNIFWQTGIDNVYTQWLDDSTVLINEMPLSADDTFGYDCRRGYSLFDEGSIEENFTNGKR